MGTMTQLWIWQMDEGFVSANRAEARGAAATQPGARAASALGGWGLFALGAFQSHSHASEVGEISRKRWRCSCRACFEAWLSRMSPCFTREGCQQGKGMEAEAIRHLGPPKASRIFQHPPPGAGRKNMKSLWSAV